MSHGTSVRPNTTARDRIRETASGLLRAGDLCSKEEHDREGNIQLYHQGEFLLSAGVYSEFYGVLARMRCANEQKRIMKIGVDKRKI
jgi:hypothetical protein